MNSIESNFVPYQIALDIKSIGFDEPCFGYYGIENELNIEFSSNLDHNLTRRNFITAPLYQQAFKFFRDKHNLDSWVYCPNESKGYFAIILKHKRFVSYNENFDTYEEAELACLNKLIEIVKNGNKS